MPARTAEAAVEIDAPIEIIWRAMIDLAAYPEWNPFIVRADAPPGEPRPGTRMRLDVRWGSGGGARAVEEVTRLEPPPNAPPSSGRRAATFAYRFTGWLDTLGLVRGTRVQMLEQTAGERARYHTREEFRGLLCGFLPLAKVQDGFTRQAEALRRRAEELARKREEPT
ncbi:MAG TPA: SRPBCC domain-containing protein [Polyangia bacterium]|nr:SRPBCC domain-containing protein [Polyangia bacterium]